MVVCKASLDFKKDNPQDKLEFGNNVVTCLTNLQPDQTNPFPDLPIALTNLSTFNENLSVANSGMQNGGKSARIAQKKAVTEWNNAYTTTANYVSIVAQKSKTPIDAETIVDMAGYVPTKTKKIKKPAPGAVDTLIATISDKKGAISVGSKSSVPYAGAYLYAAIPDGADVVFIGNMVVITCGEQKIFIAASTKKQTIMNNMPKQINYSVTMMGINAAGAGPAAAPQEVVPQ